MDLIQLFDEFIEKTTIQKEEHLKTLKGAKICFSEAIYNISTSEINLTKSWNYIQNEKYCQQAITILFDKNKFQEQLLKYGQGDEVNITAELKSALFDGYTTFFILDLVSIKLLNTFQSRLEKIERQKRLENKKDSGCFIATVCYGDFNASEVLVLRVFRDEILLKVFIGKIIVKIYYLFSPFFAKKISKSEKLKKVVKSFFLEPIVTLIKNGKIINLVSLKKYK